MNTTAGSLAYGREEIISWVHFGDLHLTTEAGQNYQDFVALIEQTSRHMKGGLSFAVLPGDVAEDGTEAQYKLATAALNGLALPVYVIPGDHDRKTGTLENFWRAFPQLPKAFSQGRYLFLFLNSLQGVEKDSFDLGDAQSEWLVDELERARSQRFETVIFMHTYPSELANARLVRQMFLEHRVLLVEMGHTHYNELANDGRTLYAATRSTGQIEEGAVGFSITSLDKGVVSWKFKEVGHWPFVMITNPLDSRLITRPGDPGQVLQGTIMIRARVWGAAEIAGAICRVGEGIPIRMAPLLQAGVWESQIDTLTYPDGDHTLTVEVTDSAGCLAQDSVDVLINQHRFFEQPKRKDRDMDNHVGAYARKGILGTQLGPNKNGKKW